eukprot:9024201-Alexandrium_andersonii.AAC.1
MACAGRERGQPGRALGWRAGCRSTPPWARTGAGRAPKGEGRVSARRGCGAFRPVGARRKAPPRW